MCAPNVCVLAWILVEQIMVGYLDDGVGELKEEKRKLAELYSQLQAI